MDAAWVRDPMMKFDHRWFDGSAWTSQVSRAGTVLNDRFDLETYKQMAAQVLAAPFRQWPVEMRPAAVQFALQFFGNAADGDLEAPIAVAGGIVDLGKQLKDAVIWFDIFYLSIRAAEMQTIERLGVREMKEAISSAALKVEAGGRVRDSVVAGRDFFLGLAGHPYDIPYITGEKDRVCALPHDAAARLLASIAVVWSLLHGWFEEQRRTASVERSLRLLLDYMKVMNVTPRDLGM